MANPNPEKVVKLLSAGQQLDLLQKLQRENVSLKKEIEVAKADLERAKPSLEDMLLTRSRSIYR